MILVLQVTLQNDQNYTVDEHMEDKNKIFKLKNKTPEMNCRASAKHPFFPILKGEICFRKFPCLM